MPAFDFARARDNMIENDVRTNDVTDKRLIAAMREVPRELFVPEAGRMLSYSGMPIAIGHGRHLLDARTFAKLAQALAIAQGESVLEIGSGTGYGAAVFAAMGAVVTAAEENEQLAAAAERAWATLGLKITMARGPLAKAGGAKGPFDVVFIAGLIDAVTGDIEAVLKPEGRLGAIIADGPIGRATVYQKVGDTLSGLRVFDASPPRLPGFETPKAFML